MALNKDKKLVASLESIQEKYNSKTKYKPLNYYSCGDAFLKAAGIPGPAMGHVTMFLGHSNTSKTTAMITAAAYAQSIGHLPVFIITERKWSWEYAVKLGLDAQQTEDGEWRGRFIFNDGFKCIEEVTAFINQLLDEQQKGNIPYSLFFCWDSIGSVPSKMTLEGKGGTMWDAKSLADNFGKNISRRINESTKEDTPYYNSIVIVNQPYVTLPDNPYDMPEIVAKGGNAVWLSSSFVVLFGKAKKSGVSHITATKNGRKVVFATKTRISLLKNHVTGMQYHDGKLIATPHGYIEDSKEALEDYKKRYSTYWNQILNGGDKQAVIETVADDDFLMDTDDESVFED